MAENKVRLGGMALANGVLVHGPTSWACAVRTPSGEVKVASGPKPRVAVSSELPFLRGPARLLEAVLVLPRVKRELPEARFPFERKNVLAAMAAAGVAARVPERMRKPASLVASLGAFGVSTEVFGWMTRHPEHPVARLLAWPGTELQSRFATAEPSPEQVEVANAALDACLELEQHGDH